MGFQNLGDTDTIFDQSGTVGESLRSNEGKGRVFLCPVFNESGTALSLRPFVLVLALCSQYALILVILKHVCASVVGTKVLI